MNSRVSDIANLRIEMTNDLMNFTMLHSNTVKVKCDWQSNVCGLDIENCVVARPKQSDTDAKNV